MIAAWQTNAFRLENCNKHNMKWLKLKKINISSAAKFLVISQENIKWSARYKD